MDNLKTIATLENATARIERVIYLAGALAAGDALPEDLREFLQETETEHLARCFGTLPDFLDEDPADYMLAEWLIDCRHLGWLVQFAAPVKKPIASGGRIFSWGYYRTRWFYAESVEQAIQHGLDWVKACQAADDAKEGAPK
jgi:hypothetical protein